ncbi:MAG: hypothetical protein M1821_002988 [Bathelium mastoideum]|nr:MAG: hypothetical protein M1821_002988 [Bathelium mastoideum]KAI9681881.1 MAG: hypothetical protein M1822_006958 [Bathelium mastoideum]
MRVFGTTLSVLLAGVAVSLAAPNYAKAKPAPNHYINSTCPAYLPSKFLFPNLIVPVSQKKPDTAYGTVYSPKVSPNDFCTIFNLHIPPWAHHKACTLEFLFPRREQLETSSFTYNGPGHFTFTGFPEGTGARAHTTWNTRPRNGRTAPRVLEPGNAYTIYSGSCDVGRGQTLEVSGMMCSNDTSFQYFQDFNPCPIGIYVTVS